MVTATLLIFSLIGETNVTIDGNEVKQCQYIAKKSNNYTVMTTYVPPSFKCERTIKF
ncbi:hypothetical protein VP3_0021 [Vibrio phage VP3]|jgi:hypothetical protein|uniref:Uncharacterized protein n=9 Tax=Chatterjeevirus TaxID=2732679 RepID=A0A2D0YLJ4_9CAUD|nr:hypothetical protein ViPhICP3_gp26 [Vibrio phage ICP3]AFH14421.1 hypothetical protein VP3_0021 [Vibrio phage VP3]ASV42786.1 hypothetical protein [Vibrio phage JSF11]ASV42922.1 hypothetical protein [Vibrio phage JSF30]ASV43253.1 hypothetical protein [Vibrio phage JSF20]ASV43301.1 hypothetical protein [Vibrio phage JSF24]ASV43349.1 hypothetical protein [Vibrio phage JSF34]AVH85434.1 hypothetical protein Rostov1_00029 [Vibrio phage Rostov-1]